MLNITLETYFILYFLSSYLLYLRIPFFLKGFLLYIICLSKIIFSYNMYISPLYNFFLKVCEGSLLYIQSITLETYFILY
jgi:hypothetical protein